MGYTPLFDTLTKGTLCGRWPDIGLWPIVLSLADRHGIVDVTPTYIAGVTGLPAEEVTACMKRFCEPDPHSRSSDEGGARLVLLDEHRAWGWRVVNHAFYREKARKAASDAERVADGRNAERMKDRTRGDPRRPAPTGPQTQTQTQTQTTDSERTKKPDRRTARAADEPAEFVEIRRAYPKRSGGQRWGDALKFFKRRLAEGERAHDILAGVQRYADFARLTDIEHTKHVQQAATFLGDNRGYLEQWHAPPRAKSAVEQAREDLRRNHGDSSVVSEQRTGQSDSDLGSFARLLR